MSENMKADFITDAKKKIKKEITRRNGYGSISKYSDENYDFEHAAEVDSKVFAEHGEKTINLAYAIKDPGIIQAGKGKVTPENAPTLTALINTMAKETMEGDTSSCRGACTGLCYGSCIGGCNGCSGQCNTGCLGCSASCGSGCAGGVMYA